MAGVLTPRLRLLESCLHALSSCLARWTKPLTSSLPLQTMSDLGRSKSELVAENVFCDNNSSCSNGRGSGQYARKRIASSSSIWHGRLGHGNKRSSSCNQTLCGGSPQTPSP